MMAAWAWIKRWGGWTLAGILMVVTFGLVRLGRWRPAALTPSDPPPPAAGAIRAGLGKLAAAEATETRRLTEAADDARVAAEGAQAGVMDETDEELLDTSRDWAERKRRERGSLLIVLGLLLTASSVRAEDVEPAAGSDGRRGYWVEAQLWRETLADAKGLEPMRKADDARAAALAAALRTSEVLRLQVIADQDEIAAQRAKLKAQGEALAETRAKLGHWSRSYTFTAAASLLSALGATMLIIYGT